MYAIIETGGKQYRVEKDDVIEIELIDAKHAGDKVEFKNVLFLNTGSEIKIGNPHLSQSTVQAEFVQEISGPKVTAFKYKRRKPNRRKVGHRQHYSRVKITEIIA
jgi:large subunit ribosomal protein L21